MKPGSCILFIDNDGGGFHNIFLKAANKCNLFSIYGPFRHKNYLNETMKMKKFGFTSCFKTTVTVHILQKPLDVMSPYDPFFNPCTGGGGRQTFSPNSPGMSPPTPIIFNPVYNSDNNEDFDNENFFSRPPITPVPTMRSQIVTPLFNPVNSPLVPSPHIRRRNGCFPLRQWRNTLAAKVRKFKSRTRAAWQKKNHPIFRL